MDSYNSIPVPADGAQIRVENGTWTIPDNPIIPFIEGDGIGRDIWKASRRVFDAAVEKAYAGKRKIAWFEVLAAKNFRRVKSWLPQDTLDAITRFHIAIKGPLTTPVGGGIRSLNVSLRQILDLYVCQRPVKYYTGVPSPMKRPEKLDVVIFRENTEDVYAGIEYREGTPEAQKVIEFLTKEMGAKIRLDSGIGIKPMSVFGSKRLIRQAIKFALANGRRSVTLVHKGNIMKFTEGAFRDWGYELVKEEFADVCIAESEVQGEVPAGKLLVKDRIADSIFQQVLLRPGEYDVLATPNLNGDYLSDACAAQVGGLGMAPGANIGDAHAIFEATHGTAPNTPISTSSTPPASCSRDHDVRIHELEGSRRPDRKGNHRSHSPKEGHLRPHRQMEGATKVKTSEFATAIIENMA